MEVEICAVFERAAEAGVEKLSLGILASRSHKSGRFSENPLTTWLQMPPENTDLSLPLYYFQVFLSCFSLTESHWEQYRKQIPRELDPLFSLAFQ